MTIDELRKSVGQGRRYRYLFFWGHRPRPDGAAGPSCFSQWYGAPFTVSDEAYPTGEHYMMARKAALFGDELTRRQILAAPSPGAAKALGRQVKGFSEERWEQARFAIVVEGNIAKFTAHPDLRGFLLGTRRRVLVEASPTDRIWGIGLARDDPRAEDPRRWRGLNLLGFALMAVRDQLQQEG